jgi:hypothetical protein
MENKEQIMKLSKKIIKNISKGRFFVIDKFYNSVESLYGIPYIVIDEINKEKEIELRLLIKRLAKKVRDKE